MKKIDLNKMAKRFFLGNMIAAALFFSMHANATKPSTTTFNLGGDKIVDSLKSNKLEVKYLGNQKNSLEFDVNYNNVKGNTFSFVVTGDDGEVLYEKQYNNKQFHKKVLFPMIIDFKRVSFSIVSNKENFVQTKEIVVRTNYIEDVLVKIN